MKKKIQVCGALVTGLLFGASSSACAQSLKNVTYVGGTMSLGNGTRGVVSLSSSENLVFASSKIVIPYTGISSYESSSRKRVHVGLLTEGIWRLLAPWPEVEQLTLSFRDSADQTQVVVLEMPRTDEHLLVDVLKARVPRNAVREIPPLRPPVYGKGKVEGN